MTSTGVAERLPAPTVAEAKRFSYDGVVAPPEPRNGFVWRLEMMDLKISLRFLLRLPATALLLLIRLYQRTLSPALPAIFGPACGCRFSPTCSHYAAEAIRTHGALIGTVLAAIRLVKCTPLHPGGIDPVPQRKDDRTTGRPDHRAANRGKPRCRRSPVLPSSSGPVVP